MFPAKQREKPSVIKRFLLRINLRTGLAVMLLLLLLTSLLSYVIFGPYYSPDTANYFNFSASIFKENIWTGIYSPFYPLLLHCLAALPISVFDAANWLILVQYALSAFFLLQWVKTISNHFLFDQAKKAVFTLVVLIGYHSWWSFRIVTWAHADATFYCLLIVWIYYLSRYQIQGKVKHLLIISLLSALMIWVKLNALFLIPFYFLLFFCEQKRSKWLAPFLITLTSYEGYQYFSQNQLFDQGSQSGFSITSYFSPEKLEVLTNNLAELFKATGGFIVSDLATASIPFAIALPGGILILLSLIGLAVREIAKGVSISSLFLLSGLVYLLLLLAFQQMSGFEEINYRTLFPYFLGISGYVLIQLMHQVKFNGIVLLLAILMTSHTLAGHLLLWNREEVNGLFEVEKLAETALVKHIHLLHEDYFSNVLFLSNHPEKLSLLLNDPYIAPYDPESIFMDGKRRLIPPLERQQNMEATAQKLARGQAVVVLFGEDKKLYQIMQNNDIIIKTFTEGMVLYKK